MMVRSAARILVAGLLGLSLTGIAYAARSGHGGGHSGHSAGSRSFHGGGHAGHFVGGGSHFNGGHFHGRVFIGGAVYAPFYFPPPPYNYSPYYYDPPPVQYMEPYPAPLAPQSSYWFYCPDSGAYYPYVQQCPSGWQQVTPQPPS